MDDRLKPNAEELFDKSVTLKNPKTPNPKFQISTKSQSEKKNFHWHIWNLVLGICLGFGISREEFGRQFAPQAAEELALVVGAGIGGLDGHRAVVVARGAAAHDHAVDNQRI